ncbi:hypothetical protein PF001_g14367 [Phytophthora fragariae]|uniref:AGC-kinase C-terminal domain-containing protein n=1 Tax=Phytophthora fragariae TaxID=53985 RepID=A0A6A4D3R9_9STRA|nr:hypothetical protein PF001_g14367 [Phytophthora fragariae]
MSSRLPAVGPSLSPLVSIDSQRTSELRPQERSDRRAPKASSAMIKVKWDSTYKPAANGNGNGNGNGKGNDSSTATNSSATSERPTLTALMDGIVISSTSSNVGGTRRPPMPKWDMGTISEDTMPAAFTAASAGWANDRFELTEGGDVRNRASKQRISKQEIRDHGEEVLRGLIDHVHTRMLQELLFLEQAIPPLEFERSSVESGFDPGASHTSSSVSSSVRSSSSSICSTNDGFRMMIDTDEPRCIFHTSKNFSVAEKLLVFVCSFRGLSCGIWSRSVLLKDGVQVGSMLPYFQKAIAAGYGILVMNPNMNTQLMVTQDGTVEKMPIRGSSNAEEHCDHVWRNYIFPSAAHKVHFIAYGYGGVLVTQLIAKYRYELKSRLGNVAFIESSHKIDPSWNSGFKRFFSQHSISWSRSDFPLNTELSRDATAFAASNGPSGTGTVTSSDDVFSATASSPSSRSPKSPSAAQLTGFGCICLSAGPCEGANESPAFTTKAVLDTVFAFLASPTPYEFQRRAARELRLNTLLEEQQQARVQGHEEHGGHGGRGAHGERGGRAQGDRGGHDHGDRGGGGGDGGRPPRDQQARGRKESVYDAVLGGAAGNAARELKPREYDSLTIDDFDLLRVVGRGYTPFYHANRKRNFQNIVKLPLRFPSEFSDDARSLLRGLICRNPAKRLGSGPCGAQEIMDHPFFSTVDWEKLYKRDVPVPFRPVVKSDGEVNNVPEFFKRQEVVDSVVSDAPIGKSHVFQGFSYTDPYNL